MNGKTDVIAVRTLKHGKLFIILSMFSAYVFQGTRGIT